MISWDVGAMRIRHVRTSAISFFWTMRWRGLTD